MMIRLTKDQNFFLYILLFSISIFIFSCDDDGRDFVLEEGRCQYGDVDGIAEINGINRFLSIGEFSAGVGVDDIIYRFSVGGYRPDCSLYEQIDVAILLNRDSIVDGTYEIVRGGFSFAGNQQIGTVVGDITTEVEDSLDRNTTELVKGTMTIKEVGLFRFEIEVEANGPNNLVTLQYSNPSS